MSTPDDTALVREALATITDKCASRSGRDALSRMITHTIHLADHINRSRQFYASSIKDIRMLRVRIADLERERAWNFDMEAAPKDGTRLALFQPDGDGEDANRTVAEGSWGSSSHFDFCWCMEAGDYWLNVIAWRHLPAPPETDDGH